MKKCSDGPSAEVGSPDRSWQPGRLADGSEIRSAASEFSWSYSLRSAGEIRHRGEEWGFEGRKTSGLIEINRQI
jgi:hypothetical protein